VAGLPVICIDARHAKAALSLKVNKTDANDAFGLAQIMRVGWYREVTVKGLDCQAVRALLVARAQIVSQITTTKNCVRGILKTFGRVLPKGLRSQFPGRVRAAIDGDPILGAIIEPTLRVLEAMRAQLLVYNKAVIQRARGDDTARQLMSAPGVGTVVALAYMTGVEDPARFKRSSSVAAYFGMTPRRYQSGEVDHAGRISKCGDGMVRGLLFESAKVLLSRSARPSALKTWGEALGKRIGPKKWRLPASLLSSCTACGRPARRSNGTPSLPLQPPEVDRIPFAAPRGGMLSLPGRASMTARFFVH
jgi:transposase